MRFTWLTYRIAIRRSFNREFGYFSGGMNTTSRWLKQMHHTHALRARQDRERRTA